MTSTGSIVPEGQFSRISVPVLGISVAELECRFINYFLEEDAERAVRKLDGRELLGNVVRVQRQVGACSRARATVLSLLPSLMRRCSVHCHPVAVAVAVAVASHSLPRGREQLGADPLLVPDKIRAQGIYTTRARVRHIACSLTTTLEKAVGPQETVPSPSRSTCRSTHQAWGDTRPCSRTASCHTSTLRLLKISIARIRKLRPAGTSDNRPRHKDTPRKWPYRRNPAGPDCPTKHN